MRGRHASQISRRRFLGGLTVEGTAGLLSLYSKPIAAEPPPKLTVIRLVKIAFLASMLAYVGLDPRQDVTWVPHPHAEGARLLAAGRVDVLMAIPPEAQALRPKQIGHVVVNTMMDRHWSHDFCCMVTGNRAFVQNYPVATKRALRLIFKSVDRCAREPNLYARFFVDRGYRTDYHLTIQALQEIPYNAWRQYDPEDAVRFYALRLHEIGMITSGPQKTIAQGTDWRFLNDLKKELKG